VTGSELYAVVAKALQDEAIGNSFGTRPLVLSRWSARTHKPGGPGVGTAFAALATAAEE
jgi:hypothetical protein